MYSQKAEGILGTPKEKYTEYFVVQMKGFLFVDLESQESAVGLQM